MRRSFIGVVLIGAIFLFIGCSGSASPTGPTAVASTGASATSSPFAGSAGADHQVPFKGTMQGTDTDSNPTDHSIDVTTDGTGNATHLGQFSFRQVVTVSFTGTDAGKSHWVAANRDSFDTTITGSGHPTDTPGEFSITETHTITGGTGRFAGAHRSFTVTRVASGITFTTSGSYDGTISSVGGTN